MRRCRRSITLALVATVLVLLTVAVANAQRGEVVLNFAGNGDSSLPEIDGPNLEATIGTPIGNPVLSCDGNSVFVFQSAPILSIRKIDLITNTVSRFVGNSTYPAFFNYEDGPGEGATIGTTSISMIAMCWDGKTTLLFTDSNTVRAVNESGYVTTFAGVKGNAGSNDGTGSIARFMGPAALSLTSNTANEAYVLDFWTNNLRLCTITTTGVVTTLFTKTSAGTGTPISFVIQSTSPSYSVLFTQFGLHSIFRWSTSGGGSVSTWAGGSLGFANGGLSEARFNNPTSLTRFGSNVFVSDQGNHAIRVISLDTNQVSTFAGGGGSGPAVDTPIDSVQFNSPAGVLVNNDSFLIMITDRGNNRIRSIPLTPSVTPSSEIYAANSTQITVSGDRFCLPKINDTEECDLDAVRACNNITLISGGFYSSCTMVNPFLDNLDQCVVNTLYCERNPIPLLNTGQLKVTVQVPISCRDVCQHIGTSPAIGIATVQNPPSVTMSTEEISIESTRVAVKGANFAPSPELNVVHLSQDNATLSCNITSANSTCIICDNIDSLEEGPLRAVVRAYGGLSGWPVQIAQVVLPSASSSASVSSLDSSSSISISTSINSVTSRQDSSDLPSSHSSSNLFSSMSASSAHSNSNSNSNSNGGDSNSHSSNGNVASSSQIDNSGSTSHGNSGSASHGNSNHMSSHQTDSSETTGDSVQSSSEANGGIAIGLIIAIGSGTAIVLLLLLFCLIAVVIVVIIVLALSKNKGKPSPSPVPPPEEIPLPDNAPEVSIEVKALEIPFDQLTIVGRPIGKGSYGEVFRAKYQGSYVAFKRLDANFNKEDVVAEFRREAHVMATLNHHKLLQFIGICSSSNVFGIITELCEKGNLSELIEHEKLTWSRKMSIISDIASGMAFIHARGFVHRDLKSPNVLINKHYDAKIADFGLAKVKDQSMKMTGLQGSPYWMAPEVTLGRDYDHKCDVYSFAIILWELLTEKEPYYNITNKPSIVHQVALNPEFRPVISDNITDLYNLPDISSNDREKFHEFLEGYIKLTKWCWTHDPTARPGFSEVQVQLEQMSEQISALML